jgi:protein-tyrosine phosphatase
MSKNKHKQHKNHNKTNNHRVGAGSRALTRGRSYSTNNTRKLTPPCAHSHPEFKIPFEGKDLVVVGGSATNPHRYDFDIWVALESHATIPKSFAPYNGRIGFHYPIQDMSVPTSLEDFNNFTDWLVDQIKAGKRVFIGCIGGHGRTGLVLAVLYYKITGDINAAQIVRTTYCSKAIETAGQFNFLNTHYGIAKLAGSKDHTLGGYGHDWTGLGGYYSDMGLDPFEDDFITTTAKVKNKDDAIEEISCTSTEFVGDLFSSHLK